MWERVNTSVFSNSFQTLALTVGTSHKLSPASTSGRTFRKDPIRIKKLAQYKMEVSLLFAGACGSMMHSSYKWFDLRLEVGFFGTFSGSLHYILSSMFAGGGSIQECTFDTGQDVKLNLGWSSLAKMAYTHLTASCNSSLVGTDWIEASKSKLQRAMLLYRSTCIA